MGHGEGDPRQQGRDLEERLALGRDHLVDQLEGRVRHTDAQVHAADLDGAELRVVEGFPRLENPALVVRLVPDREGLVVLLVEAGVVVDEGLDRIHPDAAEDVPELADTVFSTASAPSGEIRGIT